MESEKKSNIVHNFITFVEDNSETVKAISYGMTSIGLCIVLYRVRPFAKFKKPSDVPSHFLHTRVPLEGTVTRVEPSYGTLLMVDHKPLIPLPRLSNQKYLPVKMAGVNVNSNGISWLQSIVNGKTITFIPLAKKKDYLDCEVTMTEENQDLNIGEELVKLGFATINKTNELPLQLSKEKQTYMYLKRLTRAQKLAERNRNGYWQFAKQPTLLWKVQDNFRKKMKATLPSFITRQLNI